MDASQACAYLTELMGTAFKQAQAETEGWTASVLVSKKGKILPGKADWPITGKRITFWRKGKPSRSWWIWAL